MSLDVVLVSGRIGDAELGLIGIKQWRECRWCGYIRGLRMAEIYLSAWTFGRSTPLDSPSLSAISLLREFHPTHPSILLSMPSYAHIGDELIHVSTPLSPFVPLLPPVDAE
jgi:hypothetical protein